jgi:hypothetical protein
MRPCLPIFAVLLLAATPGASAWAQSPSSSGASLTNVYGPYSVYGPGLTFHQSSFSYSPYSTSIGLQSSVRVPDGGEALAGGYGAWREGRQQSGTPILGKVPYLGRGFNGVGYGRNVRNTSVSVRARVIRLREEEERQTGVRP